MGEKGEKKHARPGSLPKLEPPGPAKMGFLHGILCGYVGMLEMVVANLYGGYVGMPPWSPFGNPLIPTVSLPSIGVQVRGAVTGSCANYATRRRTRLESFTLLSRAA